MPTTIELPDDPTPADIDKVVAELMAMRYEMTQGDNNPYGPGNGEVDKRHDQPD